MEQTFQAQSNPYAPPIGGAATLNPELDPRLTLSQVLFSFKGRIPRRTFWGVSLSVMACFYAVAFVIGFAAAGNGGELSEAAGAAVAVGFLAIYIPVIWISFAIQAKRWHDRGKSAWWILLSFVPIIGPLWTLIECGCLRGTEGPNRFGADPT